jgi:hypothetical protein
MDLRARIHHEEIFRDRIVKFNREFSWKGEVTASALKSFSTWGSEC